VLVIEVLRRRLRRLREEALHELNESDALAEAGLDAEHPSAPDDQAKTGSEATSRDSSPTASAQQPQVVGGTRKVESQVESPG